MYQSDLSNEEWALIEHHFKPEDPRGSAHKHSKKLIVDAILYVVKGGITWRMLPNDFPSWKTVYDHFSRWNQRGVWTAALDELTQLHRQKEGREPTPSYAIVDSQSVKTQYDSEQRGIDGNKKVKGHKRHIIVDILGNLLAVNVHAANISDTIAAGPVLKAAVQSYPTIQAFSGDAGYRGTAEIFVSEELKLTLHIAQKPATEKGQFQVIPKRWIVERTFAWLGHFRRLAKDFEILVTTAENMIRIAMLKLTVAKCL
jgi:putative transposase